MKVLNNVVASDIRMFLMEDNRSLAKLMTLEKYLASETGGIIYNAKTLMKDIEKIVSEVQYNKRNLEILNILLEGLGVVYEEDSLFYKLGEDKEKKFNILYDEIFSKKIKPESEIGRVLVSGALSISFVAELLIKDAIDIENKDEPNLLLMSKWNNLFKMYLNKEIISEEYDEYVTEYMTLLSEIGECVLDNLKLDMLNISKESKDLLFQNLRLYKMVEERYVYTK